MVYDIFISYRRDGGDTLAQLLYDRLTERGYRVFLDIESLRSGKFNEKLLEVIDECKDVVVILPPGALERCREEGDWLYLELEHSLKARKNIIPVMMKGFEWPSDLPEELEELRNFNGICDSKDYFDAAVEKLMLLLQSRPVRLAVLSRRLKRRKSVFNKMAAVRKRKRQIAAVLIALLAVLGGYLALRFPEEKQLLSEAENVTIQLTPDEDMGASNYYEAQDILRKRFELLAAGKSCNFEVQRDQIEVVLPMEVFHGLDVEKVLKCYVTRPAQIYIGPEDPPDGDTSFLHVERTEIRSVEQGMASAEMLRFDLPDEMPEQEEYRYLKITFSDEVTRKIEEAYGKTEEYRLMQDVEKFGVNNIYYYWMFRSETPGSFYLIDNYQQESICDLVQYNYENETFSEPFVINIQLPVRWEKARKAEIKGKFQCDVSEISAPYVTVHFTSYEKKPSKGQWQDTIQAWKCRLDALETPYAFGYTAGADMEYDISIRMSPERVGAALMEKLGEFYDNYRVEGVFYKLASSGDIEEIARKEQADGSIQLQIRLSEGTDMEKFEENMRAIAESENGRIYFCWGNQRLAEAEIEEAVDGSTITFDNLSFLELDRLSGEEAYLVDYLEACIQTSKLPNCLNYTMQEYQLKGGKEEAGKFGVSDITARKEESLRKSIQKICPAAEIDLDTSLELSVWLNLEIDEALPEKVNTMIQKIYEISQIEEGEIRSLVVVGLIQSPNYLVCSFGRNQSEHTIDYYGVYMGEKLTPYKEAFKELVDSEPFYQNKTGSWHCI